MKAVGLQILATIRALDPRVAPDQGLRQHRDADKSFLHWNSLPSPTTAETNITLLHPNKSDQQFKSTNNIKTSVKSLVHAYYHRIPVGTGQKGKSARGPLI